jgi:hypothetical protein
MSPFQLIANFFVVLMICRELIPIFWRKSPARHGYIFRIGVWVCASIAITFPEITQFFAELCGLDRGADLVSYIFILLFIFSVQYLYSEKVRMTRQITELVRHISLRDAVSPRNPNNPPSLGSDEV